MNRRRISLLCAATLLVASFAVYWWAGRKPSLPAWAMKAVGRTEQRPAVPESVGAQLAPVRPAGQVPSPVRDVMAPIAAFDHWTNRFLAAPSEQREAMRQEGLRLAKERRPSMGTLIEHDPREALVHAVPMTARQELPVEIIAQLEQRVNRRAKLGVLGSVGDAVQAPIRRTVEISESERYEAFTYGKRARQRTTPDAYINGVAQDRKIAVDERPLRVLEAGERPQPGQPAVTTCPISGKTIPIDPGAGDLPPVTSETPAVEIGGTIHYLCSGGHIAAVEEQLAGEEAVAREGSSGGAQKATGAVPTTWNTGGKTHLYMRVTFADQLADPQSESSCYDMMRQVNDFIMENSYGKCYFLTTVTPLLVLPRTEAWYILNDAGAGSAYAVLNDARTAAKAAGFDPGQFDFDTVRFSSSLGGFSGQAYVGGKGCWLKSSSVGVAAHEYGHNLDLWHANYWSTSPPSSIGPGTNLEYGNIFDTMGSASAGNNHYGAYEKNLLSWMTSELVTTVRQSGTYRLYAHDQAVADQSRRYGLNVVKDTDRNYWCEFRQKFSTNTWMMSGIQVTWDPWGAGGASSANGSNSGAQILDMSPGSPDGVTDANLVIGRTFSDREAGVHITPVGKGGTTPESMDVVINLGTFPGNQLPTLTLSASSTTAATSANLTFTATASDPDGDTLSYAWDFGDKSFGTTNAPSVTKSWSTAGTYTVRCTASDMKGGVATKYVVVNIGSSSTATVTGNVTDPGGQPLEGVLVSNGLTGTSFRGAYTDSAGNYTISNLTAGSYTYAAQLAGYTFTAAFTNPLATSGNVTGANFTSVSIGTLSIEAIDASARESGDTGTFRITRTGSAAAAKAVRVVFPTGTATKTTDYTLAPDVVYNSTAGAYELTIPAGSATLDVVLTPVQDATAEGPETAVLQLVPITGLSIVGPSTATIVIDDDDTALPRVRISANDEFASETGDPAQLTVYRTGATTSALTVNFTVSGTATNGVDFNSIGTSVVIPAGASAAPINIVPINDTLVEGTESATVTLTANASYILEPLSTAYSATFKLSDDDVNVVTVTASDSTVSETGDTATFLITRTGDLTAALTVDYAVGGASLQGTDYFRLIGVATIPAGEASTTVTIVPVDDAIGEPAQTVILQLRSKPTYVVGTAFSAAVTLNDNDLPTVWVNTTDGTATEPASGNGTDTGTFTIYRAGGTGLAFTLNYTLTGTATNGSDYTTLSGTVSFAASDTSKTVTVTPLGDGIAEDMETVVLTISPNAAYVVEPENAATVQILDYGVPSVNVSNDLGTSASEAGGSIKFYVSRTGATTAALDVNYTLSGTATNGVDYSGGGTGTLTIPAGSVGTYLTLTGIDDSIAEGAESITMTLNSNLGVYSLRVPSATYWLTDNDTTGLPQVRFPTTGTTVAESAGTVQIPVTLSVAAATPVSVSYAMNGGNALANGVDYLSTTGTVTFDPGVTSVNIPVTIRDDVAPESSETVVLTLSNPAGATLGTSSFTLTITDNDTVPTTIGFAGTSSSGVESITSPMSIMVALSAVSTSAVTVDYAVTGGTAIATTDYTLASGTLTFAAGEIAKHLPLAIVSDTIAEANKTIVMTLGNPTNAALNANTTHTYTILDDSNSVSISAGTNALEGTTSSSFTITRNGSTGNAASVTLSIGGTATNGVDYQTVPATVAFAAGQASATLPITVINDSLIEGPETVSITLQSAIGTRIVPPSTASLTIADDDKNTAPSFTKGANITVAEDAGAQTFAGWATNISAGPAADSGQTVDFIVSQNNAGLFAVLPAVSPTGTLTFTPAADASGSATVNVALHDDGGTVNGGVNVSAYQSFTITVTAVNDPPTLDPLGPLLLNEDAFSLSIPLTGISSGAANETQTLTVTAISDDPALVPNPPVTYVSPDASGSLLLQPAANAFGTTTIRITVDDGGGGTSSTTRTFAVTVAPVNDAPSFTKGADVTVLEDAGPQIIPGWARDISAGPGETGQEVAFQVSNDNAPLFAAPPVIAPNGTLTFTPAADANGTATVTVTLRDDGGTANGGADTSAAQAFTITVTPVNDPPTFTKGADVSVLEDAGPQTIAGWLTNISVGPANETGQTVTFEVTNDRPELFAQGPVISPSRALQFTPAPDANGSATVTVRLHDSGGTADGGANTSPPQVFTIAVTPVNDPPTLNAITDVTMLENGAATVVNLAGLGAGAADETELLTVSAVSSAPSLIPNPTVSYTTGEVTGTLTLKPAAGANGTATITVTVNDGQPANNTITRSFDVHVTAVNDAPSFTLSSQATVLEDAGPQQFVNFADPISAGPADEAAQKVDFIVTTDHPALFAAAPSIAANGTLTFQAAPDANGVTTVHVKAHDDGGTENGGVDTSAEQTFVLTVKPVNDAPVFNLLGPSSVTAKQNAGPTSLPIFVTPGTRGGGPDEAGQALNFIVSADSPEIFATAPAVLADGTLTFTPASNTSGTCTVSIRLHDDGGTADGGADTSAAQTITITTSPVNDAPSFTGGGDVKIARGAGAQTLVGWATNISAGPADEAAQALDFIVAADVPSLFAAAPSISAGGTLSFTPSAAASGSATVTVRLHDDGGTADGGVDTSPAQTFTITVTSISEELGAYHGLVQAADGAPLEAARFGTIKVNITAKGKFTGRVQAGTVKAALKGAFDDAGVGHFDPDGSVQLSIPRRGADPLQLALSVDVADGTDKLTGILSLAGTPYARIEADRALYTAAKSPVAPLQNLPDGLAGTYTIVFAPGDAADQLLPTDKYPQGNGFGWLKVARSGVATLRGTLGDGTAIHGAAPLSKANRWPMYAATFTGKGSISGWVSFADEPGVSDLAGLSLNWFRPPMTAPTVKLYRDGWPGGILADLVGSKYVAPSRTPASAALPGLPAADSDGNAELTFSGGGLVGAVRAGIKITPAGAASPVAPNAAGVSVSLKPANGAIRGAFTHPQTRRSTPYRGVILQKQQRAAGYFVGGTECGAVTLAPQEPASP